MTNQEAFERAAKHLLKQNKKSFCSERRICQYRGPNGLKCAVGALYPDSEHREEFDNNDGEGIPASAMMHDVPSLEGLDVSLLDRLQRVHDDWEPSAWPRKLRECGRHHGLDIPSWLEAA